MKRGNQIYFLVVIVIIILGLLAYMNIFNIYEVTIRVEPNEIFADNQSVITITAVPLNSFGKKVPFRDVKAKFEYRSLIDMQTAGILEKGYVGETTDILPNGVMILKLETGVFTNVSFGISYGGSNIIGTGAPHWYKYPGVNLRVRIINESE